MARYQEQIPLNGVNEQFVAGEITRYMQYNGYVWSDYNGQGTWIKKFNNPWAINLIPTVKIHFIFYFNETSMILEAFVIWPMAFFADSGEYGIDSGMIGSAQKKVLREQIAFVRGFIYNLLQSQNRPQ